MEGFALNDAEYQRTEANVLELRLLENRPNGWHVVVVDSAPVLGLADSPELSALADGVIMVIEADRGRGGHLKAAVRRLRALRPIILGAVLTKFDPTKGSNSYSAYYGYDYYQYKAGDADL